MPTVTKKFDEVVCELVAAQATKNNQNNFYHTWYGWVSKNTLHITSKSGARRKEIWHFGVDDHQGKNLMLRNTTGTADCWTKSAGENELEKLVFGLNPYAKVEYVEKINHTLQSRGTDCGHQTSRGHNWWHILADGNKTITRKAGVVENHSNQFHIGCPTGSDDVQVTGGTYAINWSNRYSFSIDRLYITPDANPEDIIFQIQVRHDLWRIPYNGLGMGAEKRAMCELAAQGRLQPSLVAELLEKVSYQGRPDVEINAELFERVKYYHPDSIRQRELTNRIIGIISDGEKFEFFEGSSIVIILPKGKDLVWETKETTPTFSRHSFNTVLSQWRYGDNTQAKKVHHLSEWAENEVRKTCYKELDCDLEHVEDNITMASDIVIVIERDGKTVMKNGENPNVGWGRVAWNRWFAK